MFYIKKTDWCNEKQCVNYESMKLDDEEKKKERKKMKNEANKASLLDI